MEPSRKSINKSVERRDLQEGLVVHGIDNKPKLNRSTNIDQEISVIAYGILRPRASKFVVSSKIHKTIGRAISACHTVRSTYKECRSDRLNVPVK